MRGDAAREPCGVCDFDQMEDALGPNLTAGIATGHPGGPCRPPDAAPSSRRRGRIRWLCVYHVSGMPAECSVGRQQRRFGNDKIAKNTAGTWHCADLRAADLCGDDSCERRCRRRRSRGPRRCGRASRRSPPLLLAPSSSPLPLIDGATRARAPGIPPGADRLRDSRKGIEK